MRILLRIATDLLEIVALLARLVVATLEVWFASFRLWRHLRRNDRLARRL